MNKELIIRDPILMFEQEIQFHQQVSLKLCYDQQIYKFNDFDYDPQCRRWHHKKELRIPWPNCEKVQLQVYYEQDCKLGGVLGEGSLNIPLIMSYLNRQTKIALVYDGVFVGSLYCQISNCEESDDQMAKNFLYMHKIEIVILEDISQKLTINITKNAEPIYSKDFYASHKSKSLFPNIKIPVKMSDIFTIHIQSHKLFIKDVIFLTDNIKRGKTSTYESWLRNKSKNKLGELKVEYFLQNIFLQNQRQSFARNGIYPQQMKSSHLQGKWQQKLRKSGIFRSLKQADQRINKINKTIRNFIHNIQEKQNEPKNSQVKQSKNTVKLISNYQRPDTIKENKSPAFRTSIHK